MSRRTLALFAATLVSIIYGVTFTIAKDVKLQIYFNPNQIATYRLIGYENRMLAKEDFDNDKKDAGELGAGHTVTALYEVTFYDKPSVFINLNNDLSKQLAEEDINFKQDDYLILKMRYKNPDDSTSHLMISHLDKLNLVENVNPSNNIKFASSVALYGMLLRESAYVQKSTYLDVLALAESSKGNDSQGYRKEFIDMVKSTNILAKK
jgi:Ca-activated chloride channel family protein